MKYILSFFMTLSLLLQSCADGADPDTLTRDELSPPLNLVTITGDQSVELRWNAQNFEDELQGYHVFMYANKSIDQIVADGTLPGYPSEEYTADFLRQASIPRCEDNNSFYALFGVEAGSDESCESSILLQDSEDEGDEGEKASILSAKQVCYDPDDSETNIGSENVSVVKDLSNDDQDGEGIQRCLIKGLTNGTNYTFFVVAVLGEDFDEISWSSNLVDDTPAPVLFDEEITLVASQYVSINITPGSEPTAEVSTPSDCDNVNNTCNFLAINKLTDDVSNKLYLGRDSVYGNYPQRVVLSSSENGNVEFAQGRYGTSDSVSDDQEYNTIGEVQEVYEKSSFNFALASGDDKYYGKIVLHDFNYADPVTKTSDLTVRITVILQPTLNNTNYFRTAYR